MATLSLDGVAKQFGSTWAVEPTSLDIGDGELVCLLGPSGSGKTTLLRMIGGLETPTAGRILIDDEDVAQVPAEKRPTSMVFQSHALWTHMKVFDNVAFGLRLRRMKKQEIRERVRSVLDLVGLDGFADRMPGQLSGGQQQRVAIARCLVLEPKILLMDEPFASLDQHLRERLREEVRQIQRRLAITTVFVTHGQDEALALADRIVVMSTGMIEQVGTATDIYSNPRSEFVAGFIGAMNMVPAEVRSGSVSGCGFSLAANCPDGPVSLAVRPEDIVIGETGAPYRLERLVNMGAFFMAEVVGDDQTALRLHLEKSQSVREGDTVRLSVNAFALFRDGQRLEAS